MDIILGSDSLDRSQHARAVIKKIAQKDADPAYPHNVIPIGIAHHLARYPKVCDECGETFWSRDEWGTHLGCKGEPRPNKTGF